MSYEVIGYTYEKRPLYVAKIGKTKKGKNGDNLPKENIFIISNIHAREDYSSMLTMKTLDYLLYTYYDSGNWGDYDIKSILDNIDIYIMPMVNPDGYNISQNGIKSSNNYDFLKSIKNVAKDDRWWKANARGVDLNRNFDDGNWELDRPGIGEKWYASQSFKGPTPNSELETKAIQAFCNKVTPLMAMSFHSSGNLVYWADTDTHSRFDGIDTEIVNKTRDITGYTLSKVSTNPAIFGCGFENWFKVNYYRFAMCVELSPHPGVSHIQHPDGDFDRLVWSRARYLIPQMAVDALTYQTSYYDVYQGELLLKTFYTKDEAIKYAKRYNNSHVVNNSEVIYKFTR